MSLNTKNIPKWALDMLKGVKEEVTVETKIPTVENIGEVKARIAGVLKSQRQMLTQYESLVNKTSEDIALTQTELELRDSIKQVKAFIEDISKIDAKLSEQEKALKTPTSTKRKRIARENVFDKNLVQKDSYTVADPTAVGDKKRELTISLVTQNYTLDNDTKEEEYEVTVYWTAVPTMVLFEKGYPTEEEAQQIFNNLKIKLGEVDKLVKDNNLEEAESKTKEFLDTLIPISSPVVEAPAPITTTQAEKKASLEKKALLIDQITLTNKKEILAFTGGKDGEYVWQKGNRVEYGTYKGAGDYITDAKFEPIKVLEFSSNEAAVSKAKEFVNTEGLRDIINRFTLEQMGKTVPPPIPDVKKDKPTSLPKEVEVGKPPVTDAPKPAIDAPEGVKPEVPAPAKVEQDVALKPMTETVPGEGVTKSNLEVQVVKVASPDEKIEYLDGVEYSLKNLAKESFEYKKKNDVSSEEAVKKTMNRFKLSLPDKGGNAEVYNEVLRLVNVKEPVKKANEDLKDLSTPNTWEYLGHKIEMKEYSHDRNEWAYYVDEDYSEDNKMDSMEEAQERIKDILAEDKQGSIRSVSYHYGEVNGNDYVLFNEAEQEIDRISLNSVVKQALNSFPGSIKYDSINVKGGNVEVLQGKKVIENFNIASLVNVWMSEVKGIVKYVDASLKSADYLADVVGMSSEVLVGLSPEEYSKLNSLIMQQDKLLDAVPAENKAIDAWKNTGVTTPDVRDFISSEKNLQNALSSTAALSKESAQDPTQELKGIVSAINSLLAKVKLS